MSETVVIQTPQPAADRLVIVFHGVGSSAANMAPFAKYLAAEFPTAFVVSVNSPHRSEHGQGWQWFSVLGVTETNRRERVDAAMPRFRAEVAHWQQAAGVDASKTALVGFSQGAIMSLESAVANPDAPGRIAAQVVSMAGRFVAPPAAITPGVSIHLLHGQLDRVIPVQHTVQSAAHLAALGVTVTSDLSPSAAHEIDAELAAQAVARLKPVR